MPLLASFVFPFPFSIGSGEQIVVIVGRWGWEGGVARGEAGKWDGGNVRGDEGGYVNGMVRAWS